MIFCWNPTWKPSNLKPLIIILITYYILYWYLTLLTKFDTQMSLITPSEGAQGSHPPTPLYTPSADSPAQVRPSWKMYWQHTSHHVFSPPDSKSCPSPDSSLTLGSFSPGVKMVLTSGGLKPFFRPLTGPPPGPSIPFTAASGSGLCKPSAAAGFTSGCPLSLQAASRLSRLAGWGDGCRRTALTTTAPLLALEIRILAPGGGQVASGGSRDLWIWTVCTVNGESSVTEERVGAYFRPWCTTLNITHTPQSAV